MDVGLPGVMASGGVWVTPSASLRGEEKCIKFCGTVSERFSARSFEPWIGQQWFDD